MNSREFKIKSDRYEPDREITLNGQPGRIWAHWRRENRTWRYQTSRFVPEGATRDQVVAEFEKE